MCSVSNIETKGITIVSAGKIGIIVRPTDFLSFSAVGFLLKINSGRYKGDILTQRQKEFCSGLSEVNNLP